VDDRHVELIAVAEGKTTVLCWGAQGRRYAWELEVRERSAPRDEPGLTQLSVGDEAFVAAEGIRSAKSDRPKVVTVALADGGVKVTAKAKGETDVRVQTAAGPIVHHFVVR
jgi:hypothetical protein